MWLTENRMTMAESAKTFESHAIPFLVLYIYIFWEIIYYNSRDNQ